MEQGRANAALVLHGHEVVAWCQYGSPEELQNAYHRKQYEPGLDNLPDYRITCVFVDRAHRGHGLSAVALQSALTLIADAGGGTVEGYPHDDAGAKKSVLYDRTRALFERAGFAYVRSKTPGAASCAGPSSDARQSRRDFPVPCLPLMIMSVWAVTGRSR